jgi:hypothetical protein
MRFGFSLTGTNRAEFTTGQSNSLPCPSPDSEKSQGDFPIPGISFFEMNTPVSMPATANQTKKKPALKLQTAVGFAVFAAVLIGMGGWTAWEYLTGENPDANEFLTHHLLPALVIGTFVWCVLTILLGKLVITPTEKILESLYRMGSGRLDPLELDSRIEEIRSVVSSVNLLAHRLKDSGGNASFGQVQDRLVKIRKDMRSMVDAAGDDAGYLLEIVRELRALEGDLLAISQAK